MSVLARARNWSQAAFYPFTIWLNAWLGVIANQFVDPDLWGRLSVAALYFQTGRFPYRDVFSYTAPHARWIDHEWLTGFVFYGLITQLGEPALIFLHAAIVLAVLALIFGLHRRVYQVSGLYGFYGGLLLAPLYGRAFYPMVRSHVFSFLGFMGFVFLLEKIRLKQLSLCWLGLLPPLLALWGNFHGGVALGFILVVCYGVDIALQHRSWRASVPYGLAVLGGVLLLALFNPYGIAYWAFLLSAWGWERSRIQEWSPLPLGTGLFLEQQLLVLGVVVLLIAAALVWAKAFRSSDKTEALEKLGLAPALVLLLLVVMTLKSVRLQSFLSVALLAYLPLFINRAFGARLFNRFTSQLGRLMQGSLLRLWVPSLVLLGSVAGLVFLGSQRSLLTVPVNDELSQGIGLIRYPVAALQYLRQSPYRGNLLVRFGLGEFAYWQLYPRFKVSMDGRYEEVYTQAQFLANDAFFDRKHPQQAIQAAAQIHHSKADFILIEANMPNLAALEQSGQWQQLYGDPYFRIYGRKTLVPYVPSAPIVTKTVLTIGDFVRPDTLQRFAR